MADGYLLSEEDRAILKLIIEKERSRLISPNYRAPVEPDDQFSLGPEVYVAYTPVGGIPANPTTGTASDILSSAECEIYRKDENGRMELVEGLTKIVYNLSLVDVPELEWVLLKRDKWGTWFVEGQQFASSVSTPPIPLEVKTTNPGTGDTSVDVTPVSIIQVDQASGLQLVSSIDVTIKAQDTSSTHKGVVNLTTQNLGIGRKIVTGLNVATNTGASTASGVDLNYISQTAVGAANWDTLQVGGAGNASFSSSAGAVESHGFILTTAGTKLTFIQQTSGGVSNSVRFLDGVQPLSTKIAANLGVESTPGTLRSQIANNNNAGFAIDGYIHARGIFSSGAGLGQTANFSIGGSTLHFTGGILTSITTP